MQHSPGFLCVHHELHEYDQDEDSSKISGPDVLSSRDVFAFRKVLVAIERFDGLFQRTGNWLFLAGCFAWRVVKRCRLSIGQSYKLFFYRVSIVSFMCPFLHSAQVSRSMKRAHCMVMIDIPSCSPPSSSIQFVPSPSALAESEIPYSRCSG